LAKCEKQGQVGGQVGRQVGRQVGSQVLKHRWNSRAGEPSLEAMF
jgi:hypothetical protein